MNQIHTIDLRYLNRPDTIASYLLMGTGGALLIETGPASTLDYLEAGLREHGIAIDDLKGAVVSHIHLDHAGAAGHLARRGVRIFVHEFGAPHLIDPSRLLSSAKRIYGDEMDRLWGEIVPVPDELITPVKDSEVLEIAGVRMLAIETPGHARHQLAFALRTDRGRICFTGDAAAMIVPSNPSFISLPTPPPEFDLDAWIASVDQLDAQRFRTIYLTHFGPLSTPVRHFANVKRALRSHAEYVRAQIRMGKREDEILEHYRPWVHRQAAAAGIGEQDLPHFVSENLLRMNVMGMVRYWNKSQPTPQQSAPGT